MQPSDKPLVPALIHFILQSRGLNARGWEITPDAFRPDALPAHFSFSFKLVDENERQLGISRSLTELRGEWGGKAKQEFSELHETPSEYSGMTDWSFGELPELMEVDVGGGQMVLGYPGLSDDGESVSLCVFATGAHLWRRYIVPGPGEKGNETWPAGDTYVHGGGSTWITGSYDPELDLVYWGTGNAGPWNPTKRPGDNLYTASLLAIRPKTGEIAWHLPVHSARHVRFRRHMGTDSRRHSGWRATAQGGHAVEPQRLPLRSRPDQREAALGQAVREGELGFTH